MAEYPSLLAGMDRGTGVAERDREWSAIEQRAYEQRQHEKSVRLTQEHAAMLALLKRCERIVSSIEDDEDPIVRELENDIRFTIVKVEMA